MKKILLLALALAVAFSFLGVNSVLSLFQLVPVTVAQSDTVQSITRTEPSVSVTPKDRMVATLAPAQTEIPTLAPTQTQFPTLTPTATEHTDPTAPAATVVAAESVTKAPTPTAEQLLLDQFIKSVTGQKADLVTGVYVPGRFSLPVLQQPYGDASFVSRQAVSATQFRLAAPYGTIGLLAHNYLSGKKYFNLRAGDEVIIVYGDGNHEHYRISEIERYQALSPTSPYSDFIDLSDPNQTKMSASQLFQRVYTTQNRVVFQTCIEAYGDSSWGRIFVIANKVSP